MKKVFLLLMLTIGIVAEGKNTYIPTYKSYIHIVNGTDTTAISNNLEDLELADANNVFCIRIEHEIVTQEKVKAIKRAKRAAGWMAFSAVMSGVSTAFSDNSLQYMVRSTTTHVAADLADIYSANAKAEEKLDVFIWIDNTTDGELMVNDMDRGLIWCILPHQSLKLKLNNPEASRLRVSDPKNDFVRYATVMAGSSVAKYEISLETDNEWYMQNHHLNRKAFSCYEKKTGGYLKVDKTTLQGTVISEEEFKAIKKE